jgi:AraC-like DNA-binding protein
MLCVSSRTLKRKLQNAGLNFRGVVDDARKGTVLREVLNPALRMSDIALHAGYRGPASFTRAFLRWTGESPSQYRKRLLAEN